MTKILVLIACLMCAVACGGAADSAEIPTGEPVDPAIVDLSIVDQTRVGTHGTPWRELDPSGSARHPGCVSARTEPVISDLAPGCYLTTSKDLSWQTCTVDPNPIVMVQNVEIECHILVSSDCSCEGK